MKGLLIKDFMLMKNMKNSMLMIMVIAVGMAGYLKDLTFIMVYLAFLGTTYTSTTISYVEFDNGYSFMFSLPVTRKGYVLEKYAFGLILSGGGWLIGAILATIMGRIRNVGSVTDSVMAALIIMPIPIILLAIMLPFHLKYGGEKGRIVMICVVGGLMLAGVLGIKLAERLHINFDAIMENLSELNAGAVMAGAMGVGMVLLVISCNISIAIMKKKEY